MAEAAPPRVLVLMATYDGGDLVQGQVDSILGQKGVSVALRISDDGSADGTAELCEAIAREREDVTFRRNPRNRGVARNFMDMVYEADPDACDYVAFADQDDLWLPGKLERAVAMLREAGTGAAGALYYSDVTHADAATGEELPSDAALYRGREHDLGTLLVSNWAAGCTMVFDRGLLRLLQASPQADFPRIHDAWVHLVALSCATTVPDLSTSLIRHRITRGNVTLERVERDFGRLSPRRLSYALGHLAGERDHAFSRAAERLVAGYGDRMDPADRALAELVASLPRSLRARVRAAAGGALSLPTASENAMLKVRILGNYL